MAKILRLSIGLLLTTLAASAGMAGPPYATDDPEPTDLGRWEIYAFSALDGRGGYVDGLAGLDLNYGAVKNVQLTATLPVGFSHQAGRSGWRSGRGDLELGVKYRFFNAANSGVSAAIFPRLILPTASHGFGTGRTRLLLPMWGQLDRGAWSLFGGGGYQINPGPGNRNFVQGGVAVARALSKGFSLGTEITWQGAEATGGKASTAIGIGSIARLGGPFSLLTAGGPTFSGAQTSYHLYAALGLGF